jgi:serine/threonine protein kinase
VTQPQAFGRYELLERVSAGGMAEVFRARDAKRGTIVALKRILPNIAADEDFISMFEDEARIASQLEHPHIARTLDYGHVANAYYIAFEFVDGRDLRVIFDRCVRSHDPPPLAFLLYIFTRIGEGLSYAHSRKDPSGAPVSIVHRDVSPQNIVVSYHGDVKLIDFGIAKAAGKLSRTQAGEIKGKFGYMSPEQIRGSDVDQRTDVFSLGICMWELLTLQRLFEAPNEILVLEKIRTTVVEPPSSLNPRVPPGLDRIVCKALAKNVDERYRSAKELYRDLNALSKDTNTVATREQIAQYMRRAFAQASQSPLPSIYNDMGAADGDDLATSTAVTPSASRAQETVAMAAENKGGSDLDVFEGLGKKSSTRPPPSSGMSPPPGSVPRNGPPPPPPSGRPATIPPNTLRGLASPAPPPSAPISRPPPPPGRGALPIVVPPPTTRPSSAPARSGSSPSANAKGGGGGLDMDWDDEDEATHIFEKEGSKSDPPPAPPPASASVPVARAAPSSAPLKRTLIGVNSPAFQPPPPPPPPPGPPSQKMTPIPPPPSSVGGAFARASSIPSGMGPVMHPPPPPPPTIDPRPTPPPQPFGMTQPMMPPQQSTVPLPMPGPRPSGYTPPPAYGHDMPPMPPPPMPMNRMEATALVRPPQGSKVGIIIAVVTAVVAAAVVGLFLLPRNGTIVVRAADSKGTDAQHMAVYVDGRQTDCATSPCTLLQITPGSHFVKIAADGFDPAEQTVAVEARKQSTVEFALAGSAGAPAAGTGFKVAGSQPGVKLVVDDKEVGALPAEVHDLTPGSHKIRIAGGDRYAAVEKNVTVAKDEFQDLGNVTLRVLKGKVTVTLGTPGARVYLVSGADRRELPAMPISVELDPAKLWSLVASKAGFSDYSQTISFDDGQAEKTFNVALDAKVATAAPPPQQFAPQRPPPPRQNPSSSQHDTSSDNSSAGGGGDAFLNINSIPASSVVLDGKPIGNTPKLKFTVSPGTHTVLFVNTDQQFKKTVTVTVGAGETKAAIGKAD